MSGKSDLPPRDDGEQSLFDFNHPAAERVWWRDVLEFIMARRLQFGLGIGAAVVLLGWIVIRSSAQAQGDAAARGDAGKKEGTQPATAPEPAATPVPAPLPEVPPKYVGVATPAATKPAGPKISWSSVEVDTPVVAITFDDGPHATNTPKLLAMLKQRGIHATFFLVGECARQYPEIVKRIVAEGHEVANHSWSHPNLAKMSDDAVRSQLQRTQDAITDACGVKPVLMRPPYGELTTRQRAWVNADFGYKIILWDVDPLDWKFRNSERVMHEITTHTHNGSIILVHDIHATSVAAMPETLDALLAKGFKFVTVSELLAMEKTKPAGAVSEPRATPTRADAATPKPAAKATPKRKRAN